MFSVLDFRSFGFGGSRSAGPECLAALPFVFRWVPPGSPVFVSCCPGASAAARAAFPAASVFAVSDAAFARIPAGGPRFAARSVAMLRALAASPSPLWVCAPGRACPPGVVPAPAARCWSGSGSGSWSECAAGAGLSVPLLVFLPAGIVPPATFGTWSVLGGGWFFLPAPPPAAPPPAAPTLF